MTPYAVWWFSWLAQVVFGWGITTILLYWALTEVTRWLSKY